MVCVERAFLICVALSHKNTVTSHGSFLLFLLTCKKSDANIALAYEPTWTSVRMIPEAF